MSSATTLYLKVGAVLLLVLVIAGALYGAYRHGESVTDARWTAKWADQQTLQAKGLAAATTANRAEEQRRQAAINQVGSDAREQTKSAVVDGGGSDAAGERVREAAGKLAARTSCAAGDTGASLRSASARRAAMVLSDLFQRADKRAGELAKAYDAARIAGQACQRAYNSVRGEPK